MFRKKQTLSCQSGSQQRLSALLSSYVVSPGVVLLEEDGLSAEKCCMNEQGKVELVVQEETSGAWCKPSKMQSEKGYSQYL